MASEGKHHLHGASAGETLISQCSFLLRSVALERWCTCRGRPFAGRVQWQSTAETVCTKDFRGTSHQDAAQCGLSTERLQAGISRNAGSLIKLQHLISQGLQRVGSSQ